MNLFLAPALLMQDQGAEETSSHVHP